MSGIQVQENRGKLLTMNPFPELQMAVNLCRSKESASANTPTFQKPSSSEGVNKIQQRSKSTSRDRSSNRPRDDKNAWQRCGFLSYPAGQTCSAQGWTCNHCHKLNHFAKSVTSHDRPPNGAHQMTQETRSGRSAPLEWSTSQPKRGLRSSRLGATTATPTSFSTASPPSLTAEQTNQLLTSTPYS